MTNDLLERMVPRSKTPPGSFGARPCTTMRVRILRDGWAALPKSWRRQWMVQRIIATLPWSDFKAIRAVYAEAERLTQQTGVKHHVDHIVPLNHPRVCGLHVAHNLRCIPAWANMGKGNDWCPEQVDMFNEPEQLRLL